jgi:inhibitor of cysteine peptidase
MSIIRKSSFHRLQLVFIAIQVIVTAALAAGCASRKSTEPAAVPAGVRDNGVLVLTRADHNRTAELRVGEHIKVSLPENPGTGYTWAIDETSGRLLALDGTEYVEPTEGFIGARGERIFTFTARQSGEVALKLKYWRFWEGEASATERYAVNLRIAP